MFWRLNLLTLMNMIPTINLLNVKIQDKEETLKEMDFKITIN